MIGPWREMLTTTVKCPCGQNGRWQRMTKVYEDSEPEWEHSCDRCMFGGENNTASGTRVSDGLPEPSQITPSAPSRNPAKSRKPRKDRQPLPAPIEQKVCSRCGIVFRGYREHCVKCRRWGEPGRPPIPENEKALNPGQSKA